MRYGKSHRYTCRATICGLAAMSMILVGCGTTPPADNDPTPGDPVPPATQRVEVTIEGNGAVDQRARGDAETFEATPDDGWRFVRWFGDSDSTENPLTLNVTDATVLGARFEEVVDDPTPPTEDADEDGVPDSTDLCPATPQGETADAVGCASSQLDADNDSVTDDVDECPDSPRGATVDAAGCTVIVRDVDGDGDGVPDERDDCPDTPAGEATNDSGCAASQLDSDGDGVKDDVDACQQTPAGTQVGADGCPSNTTIDSDEDGIPDAEDQCPGTSAEDRAVVNADGCAPSQLDADNDGVSDNNDQCPDTPPGAIVDEEGCTEITPPPPGGGGGGNPVCGNDNIESGEDCDPPNGVTCDANCQGILDANGCGLGEGDCHTAHGTPGCERSTCCTFVCGIDPFCCEEAWDTSCADTAFIACGGISNITNDDCDAPTPIGDGITTYNNLGATTDGPDVVGDCGFQLNNDVWFCYTASCTGSVTVSLCGSWYDTTLAVYDGCGCPTDAPLGCDDDGCGLLRTDSHLSFAGVAGENYMIRIGGYREEAGSGTITITCGAEPDFGLAACGAGSGDCFAAHDDAPGCEDETCCANVCESHPYCCTVGWNENCTELAQMLCGEGFTSCGVVDSGDCFAEGGNGSAGCEDQVCCDAVCDEDLFCCLSNWDGTCALEAEGICLGAFSACEPNAGDCSQANGSAGCSSDSCCNAVCTEDSFCCLTEWDDTCVEAASTLCP